MICRKLRLKTRRAAPRHRLRLGRPHLPRGAALRGQGGGRHAGRGAGGARAEKIERLGLQDRVEVVLQDFTQTEGEFDKISSIGMFEHVGIANHPAYFRTVHRLLRPRASTFITPSRAAPSARTSAFRSSRPRRKAIMRYIFPGAELDHLGMSVANLERYGFEVHDVEAWREHYQRTTRLWWENLNANRTKAEAEVGPEKTRAWLLYLAGVLPGIRARRDRRQPDARLQAHARPVGPAVEPGGSLPRRPSLSLGSGKAGAAGNWFQNGRKSILSTTMPKARMMRPKTRWRGRRAKTSPEACHRL